MRVGGKYMTQRTLTRWMTQTLSKRDTIPQFSLTKQNVQIPG